MTYRKQNQNGDAAEYFTAYKFTSLFGWPFRLYGVDIGIDGEFEIQDDQNHSTGNIVKVQVKSITAQSSANPVSIRLDEEKIEYLKRFCTPVVVCAVDLKRLEIYWTKINETNAYEVTTLKKGKISFDRTSDLLSKKSKLSLQKLATPDDAHTLRSILNRLETNVKKVLNNNGDIQIAIGHLDGIEYQKLADTISKDVRDGYELAKYYPWKFSTYDISLLEKSRLMSLRIRSEGGLAINDELG